MVFQEVRWSLLGMAWRTMMGCPLREGTTQDLDRTVDNKLRYRWHIVACVRGELEDESLARSFSASIKIRLRYQQSVPHCNDAQFYLGTSSIHRSSKVASSQSHVSDLNCHLNSFFCLTCKVSLLFHSQCVLSRVFGMVFNNRRASKHSMALMHRFCLPLPRPPHFDRNAESGPHILESCKSRT